MNNHITAYRYGTSTDKFDNHVFECSNKNEHVAREPYFKVYAFMTVNNKQIFRAFLSNIRNYSHKVSNI